MSAPVKVFISWSGTRSGRVARLLHEWLPLVVDSPTFWLSSRDIPDGARWANELEAILRDATVGILVLTPENLESPWLLFEAGALSKNVGRSCVVPYLVGIRPQDLRGPLQQFQAVAADREGTRRLVAVLTRAQYGEHPPVAIDRRFTAFWDELVKPLEETFDSEVTDASNHHSNSSGDLEHIRELAQLVRSLVNERRVVEPVSTPPRPFMADALQELEGAWLGDDGTPMYARVIHGRMTAVYCYAGEEAATGEFYDWHRVDEYWFARFRWLTVPEMYGFGFYRTPDVDTLTGMWWYGFGQSGSPHTPPAEDGFQLNFRRCSIDKIPEWAERYFRKQLSRE
jgi:hypothetical protein